MSKRLEHTVLLLDDSPEDRGTYRAFLSEEDGDRAWRILEAEDAAEGLALCRGEQVHCVLLDYHLPGTDGLGFLRRLREEHGDQAPAVVMVTGRGDERVAVRALKSGASDYLIKSDVTPASLFRATRNAIEMRALSLQYQRSQEELRQSERAFRQLAESIPDVVARYDRHRRHLYVNRAIERASGFSAERVQGHVSNEFGAPEKGVAAWHDAIDQAFEGREVVYEFDYPSPDGARTFEARLSPERDASGQVVSVLSLARDVTVLRREQAQLRARVEFEQQLIGIVSHDLRSPLNATLLSVASLLNRDDLDARATRALVRIQSSAERASRLASDLLDFTAVRLGGGLRMHTRPLNLCVLVGQAVDEVQASFPERTIQVLHAGDPEGSFDEQRLHQVLINLLNNAMKYSAGDTPVTVRTRDAGPGWVALEVHNVSAAIPEAVRVRLFQPFQRGAQSRELLDRSVGLGLYIVKHIIEAHGGRIRMESSDGDGTTFTVSLPRQPPGQGLMAASG